MSVIASTINILDECEPFEFSQIEDTLVQGLSTLEAATEFDQSLRSSNQRIIDNELTLFKIEQRLMVLEAQYKSLKNVYEIFNNSLPLKALRFFKKIIYKYIKFIFLLLKKILNLFFSIFPKISLLNILKFVKNNNFIISIIVYVLRTLGMKRQAYMLPKTFIKVNKSEGKASKINSILINNYILSSRSSEIYRKIKSRLS